MSIETKYATIDRDELKRLQAESAELTKLRQASDLRPVAYLNVGNHWHKDAEVEGTCWGFQLAGDITEQIATDNPAKSMPLVLIDDALLAIDKARQVPEGFVLVPVEPTREMLVNVDEYVGGSCYSCSQSIATEDDCRRVWAAMIETAPQGDSHE